MSFVCITPKGKYLTHSTSLGHVKDKVHLRYVDDINNATVFKREPRDLNSEQQKEFESCIQVNAYEERKVILTKDIT